MQKKKKGVRENKYEASGFCALNNECQNLNLEDGCLWLGISPWPKRSKSNMGISEPQPKTLFTGPHFQSVGHMSIITGNFSIWTGFQTVPD